MKDAGYWRDPIVEVYSHDEIAQAVAESSVPALNDLIRQVQMQPGVTVERSRDLLDRATLIVTRVAVPPDITSFPPHNIFDLLYNPFR